MVTCPKCECEFEDSTEICPNCNLPLVSREDATDAGADDIGGDLPSEGLVVIESSCDDVRARQIRELLEEGGIPCFLSNELSPIDPPPEETMVLIPKEMAGEAKRLVRDYCAVKKPA